MAKRISKITDSLRQLGEIQVNDWDFMTLLNKDISELELTHSLRKLGNLRVMDWDFRTALPAVNKLAHQEVDVVGLVRRAAHYKVMDWDFRSAPADDSDHTVRDRGPGHAEMQALILRLRDFLQYVVVNMIDEPEHARIRVSEISPDVLRFRLMLVKRDVTLMIGRGGQTVAAIRGVLKATAGPHGVHVLLEILSHEDEAAGKS